jgi:hypothetical protein
MSCSRPISYIGVLFGEVEFRITSTSINVLLIISVVLRLTLHFRYSERSYSTSSSLVPTSLRRPRKYFLSINYLSASLTIWGMIARELLLRTPRSGSQFFPHFDSRRPNLQLSQKWLAPIHSQLLSAYPSIAQRSPISTYVPVVVSTHSCVDGNQ